MINGQCIYLPPNHKFIREVLCIFSFHCKMIYYEQHQECCYYFVSVCAERAQVINVLCFHV
jgi:hypothetical protein